jgi:DUF4097 and DUF4098 domain-containing protein YvlB
VSSSMRTLRLHTPRIAAIAVLCGSLSACDLAFSSFNEQASDTWTKTYPLSEGGRLEVKNTNGYIRVTATSGNQVEVSAEKIGRGATTEAAKEVLKTVEVVEDITPDRVRLETKRQGGSFNRPAYEVRYTIKVPASAQVELQNTNGEVRVTGVTRGARMATTNGEIEGRSLGGEVRATTTNGGVEIDLTTMTQPVHVSTTNGGVRVKLPPDAKADLAASVTNGGIEVVGIDLDAEGEQTRRRVSGRLNGGGPRIDLSTTNGGIEVRGK